MKVTIRGGHFVTGSELDSLIEQQLGQAVVRGALALQGPEMRNTPVRSGHLRRNYAVGRPVREVRRISVKLGNATIYARRVNYVGRSAGYVQRGFAAGKDQAKQVIVQGVADLVKQSWVKD